VIFISYSSKDVGSAEDLRNRLIARGYDCRDLFLDRDFRSGIKLGEDWAKTLLQNGRSCRAMIVLCSPNWLKSKWCFAELAMAKVNPSTLILPVVISPLSHQGWKKSGLAELQCHSMHGTDEIKRDTEFEALCCRLDQHHLRPTDYLQLSIDHNPNRFLFRSLTWGQWAASPDMQRPLWIAEEQDEFIQTLSHRLLASYGNEVCITGEPGSGKTRLVLEAIRRDENLQRQVLYYEDPSDLIEDPYLNELSLSGNESTHVFVVDDCHSTFHGSVQTAVHAFSDRIVLLTITHDHYAADALVIPPLAVEHITSILHSYREDVGQMASEYADLCKGSPRFAHLVGQSLKTDAGSIVSHPDAVRIVERIICGKAGTGNAESNVRLIVARFAALFDRFGLEKPFSAETEFLASWIAKLHPTIGLGDVLNTLHQLRTIRVLQGKRTVYFVPKALQWHLWGQWWKVYGSAFQVEQLASFPEELRSWFILNLETFPEIHTQEEIATRLLRYDDWFCQWDNHRGFWPARLFRLFGELAPERAVSCVERSLLRRTDEELFEDLRTHSLRLSTMINVLEYASIWRSTALSAVRVLRRLALAEANENGHATKTFCHFFTLGTGRAASTELSPAERFIVLDELLTAGSTPERVLGLKVCETILDFHRAGRWLGWNSRGSRREPQAWVPGDREEYTAIVREIWDRVCRLAAASSQSEEVRKALDVLGRAFFTLVQHEPFADHCISSIRSLVSDNGIEPARAILKSIIGLWRRATALPESQRSRLHDLYNSIVYSSFETRLRRFVGMAFFDDDSTVLLDQPSLDNVSEEIRKLAAECYESPELLRPHLDWLLTSADRAWAFGLELGCLDVSANWRDEIITRQRSHQPRRNTAFIGGYAEAIRRRSPDEFQTLLNELAKYAELKPLLTEIVSRTGGVSQALEFISAQLESGDIAPERLGSLLWIYDPMEIPEAEFDRWMDLLQRVGSPEALGLCIDFMHRRYTHKSVGSVPCQVIANLLCKTEVLDLAMERPTNEKNNGHAWAELLELVTKHDPTASIPVVRAFFEFYLDESHPDLFRHESAVDHAIWQVLEVLPQESWNAYFDVLHRSTDKAVAKLLDWLGGNHYSIEGSDLGLWPRVPEEKLWNWIDQDPQTRVNVIASELPPLVTEHGITAISCSFIKRYGSHPTACEWLIGSRVPGMVEGNYSDFNARRLNDAIVARETTSDPFILSWINRHIESLTADIERRSTETEDDERGHRHR